MSGFKTPKPELPDSQQLSGFRRPQVELEPEPPHARPELLSERAPSLRQRLTHWTSESKQGYYGLLYLRQGISMLWRNRFWSTVTLVVMSLLLFVVYLMIAMSAHTTAASQKVDDRLTVTAIIAQDSTNYQSTVNSALLAEQARAIPGVKAVRLVSENESRQVFLEQVGELKSPPRAQVFSEALEISVTDTEQIGQIRDKVAGLNGVQQATYLAQLVKKLSAATDYLRGIALYGAILLGLVALLVIMAVVRTSVHSERRSVTTMAEVGGSSWSISAPLLIHLGVVTLVASALASLAGWYIDPQLGLGFGQPSKELPDWLQTGRSFGLFSLFPFMALGGLLCVSAIVILSTRKYARTAL